MKKIEKIIIESFEKFSKQVMSDLVEHTSVPRATLKRHINFLIENGLEFLNFKPKKLQKRSSGFL